jgi:hypothetical protein
MNRQLKALKTKDKVGPIGPTSELPESERQYRELGKYDDPVEALKEVVAETGKKQPTSAEIEETVTRRK